MVLPVYSLTIRQQNNIVTYWYYCKNKKIFKESDGTSQLSALCVYYH